VEWTPGDWATKLATSLLGNSAPDVYEYEYLTVANVRAGNAAPLDDLFTPAEKADFDPRSLQINTYNGHIYGVPMITDVRIMYYRKSMFQKAGIAHPPTTFAELLADAKLLNKGGVKGIYLGNSGGADGLENVLEWSAGSNIVNGNKVAFDNARTVAVLQELRTLNKAGVLLLGAPTDWFDPSAFIQGLTAMQWCGLWAMPAVKKALGDDFGVIPWPALDNQSKPALWWVGWNEYVNGHSKNLAAAKAFVKWQWIQSTAIQADWAVGYGFHVPPRKSALAAATKLKTGEPAEAVSALQTYAHVLPATVDAAMSTALDDAVASAVKTDQSIPSLVHAAAVKSQAELDRELKG
jgi:multiple sugar transport system substrate-binding protein